MTDLFDGHCHLSSSANSSKVNVLVQSLLKGPNGKLTNDHFFGLMSSNHTDFALIDQLALQDRSICPFFGIHPWFSHLFYTSDFKYNSELSEYDLKFSHYSKILSPSPPVSLIDNLPLPINFDEYLVRIEKLISNHKLAFVGEVGLDKLFKIPASGFYGNNPGDPSNGSEAQKVPESRLSSCRVKISHQQAIFEKQLYLAAKLKIAISIHCVKAHGLLYDLITKNYSLTENIPSIMLHSYTGSIDQAKMWVKFFRVSPGVTKIYFSLSDIINGASHREEQLKGLLSIISDNQILLETDLSIDDELVNDSKKYFSSLYEIFRKVCILKCWSNDLEARELLLRNWESFKYSVK